MAHTLLHDDPDPEPNAGIVLLSYWSLYLTAPDKPRADVPTNPITVVPIRLRPQTNKPHANMHTSPI